MKLLFDHNLSHKLVARLSDLYPDSTHTKFLGFERAADLELWFYARTHELTIVTKDEDYSELVVLRGSPPKVIWLRIGNCATRSVEAALRRRHEDIIALIRDNERAIVEIFD